MSDDEYRTKLHGELIIDMQEHLVGWHKQGKCSCMEKIDPMQITLYTALPCEHVRQSQNDFFEKRINELDELYTEHWHNKIHDALSDEVGRS